MTEALPSAIQAIPDGGDPFLMGAKWFGLVVAALLVGAAPVQNDLILGRVTGV